MRWEPSKVTSGPTRFAVIDFHPSIDLGANARARHVLPAEEMVSPTLEPYQSSTICYTRYLRYFKGLKSLLSATHNSLAAWLESGQFIFK